MWSRWVKFGAAAGLSFVVLQPTPSVYRAASSDFSGIGMKQASPITVEYAVNLKSEQEEQEVKAVLGRLNVSQYEIDWKKQLLIVNSELTTVEIAEAIEATGRQVRIRGLGDAKQQSLGAGVCILQRGSITGVVRIIQLENERVLVEASVDGLETGKHGIHIHKLGDVTDSGAKLGEHYNPKGQTHGGPHDQVRHAGDLGNIESKDGKARFRLETSEFHVYDIIGRAIGITAQEDDEGKKGDQASKRDGNSGGIVVCGVIARSAGLFQNPKKICLCSGASIWEEDKIG